MPASKASLQVTERYRAGMVALRERAKREAIRTWGAIKADDLDGTYGVTLLALHVEVLQREAARLSSAYLAAYIGSELDRKIRPPLVDARQVGSGRSGDDLAKVLRAPMIDVKVAIRDGRTPQEALAVSRTRLVRMVGLATDTAARESLRTGMKDSPYIVGWRRAVRGTCGACMGLAEEAMSPPGTPLEIHPDCQCVSEAVVSAAKDVLPREKTGSYMAQQSPRFTAAEQDALQRYEGLDSRIPNQFMREGRELFPHDQEFVNAVDAAIEKAGPLGRSIEVSRGVPAHALESTLGDITKAEGKIFRDAGFGSSTTLREQAAQWGAPDLFAENKTKTLWDMTVHKDVKAVWMESGTGKKWGLEEVLLERDVRYVITKVERISKNQVRIKATVLPPK